jgi:hypothetical protein
MTRTLLTIVLAVVIVFTAGGGVMAGPAVDPTVTVTGQLEYVTTLATPHYEVSGYVLLTTDPAALKPLAGQDVVVTGTVSTEPSIYMRKTLDVKTIAPNSSLPPDKSGNTVTIPVLPTPQQPTPPGDVVIMPVQPGPGDVVTIPAIPGPTPSVPAPPDVTVPAIPEPAPLTPGPGIQVPVQLVPEPVPLFGTPYWLLFGRVEYTGSGFVMIQERMGGDARIPVSSTSIDLAAFAGERSGLVVERDGAPADALAYRAIAGVALTGDLGDRIRTGEGVIYSAPEHPVAVQLHGNPVAMDQLPILGNGRTLVGLRAIGGALGAKVDWNDDTQTAIVSRNGREVSVTIGSSRILVREPGQAGRTLESDIAPVVVGGRTMVPVRVLAESLGLTVGWDPVTRTVILN